MRGLTALLAGLRHVPVPEKPIGERGEYDSVRAARRRRIVAMVIYTVLGLYLLGILFNPFGMVPWGAALCLAVLAYMVGTAAFRARKWALQTRRSTAGPTLALLVAAVLAGCALFLLGLGFSIGEAEWDSLRGAF